MKTFLRKIYLYQFLTSFILVASLFTLIFKNEGLDPFQISLLIFIWSSFIVIFEVPAGVIADKYSRRNILIIAEIMRISAFVFWIIGGNFLIFAIGMLFLGARNVLTSGTTETFIYDELKLFNKTEIYEKVVGKSQGAVSLGLMFAAVLGGIVAGRSFDLIIQISILGSAVSAAILLTVRSVAPARSTQESKYLQLLKNALKETRTKPVLLYLIAITCVVIVVFGVMDEFFPLIFDGLGFGIKAIGILIAAVYLTYSIAGYTAHYFKETEAKHLVYLLIALSGVNFVLAGIIKSEWSLIFLLIGTYLIQVVRVKLEASLQHEITSNQRATVSSIKNLLFEIGYMGLILVFGIVSKANGTAFILLIAGAIIFASAIIFPFLKPKADFIEKK